MQFTLNVNNVTIIRIVAINRLLISSSLMIHGVKLIAKHDKILTNSTSFLLKLL